MMADLLNLSERVIWFGVSLPDQVEDLVRLLEEKYFLHLCS